MADPDERSPPLLGKTASNESRKLVATAGNNLGVALLLAAFVQPALLYLQQRKPADPLTVATIAAFGLIAMACFVFAHYIIRRLED